MILRICLPIISVGLFGQIFFFLTTLFICENGNSYISKELECRNGDWYEYYSPFIIIAMIFHIFIALLTNTLYYKTAFIVCKSDILRKINSIPDIFLLLVKIVFTL